MMMQAVNPFLPGYEYIPDGEPHVFGGRVYLYGSHDRFDGSAYCQNDYVCWSAPVTDLSAWRCEGEIYARTQDPRSAGGAHRLFAPDVQQGHDGRYYLFYALSDIPVMSVAVCDSPAGRYAYYGDVHFPDGHILGEQDGDLCNFDPGVFIDDDGRVYLYSGFAPRPEWFALTPGRLHDGGYCMELAPDMLTITAGPRLVFPRAGNAAGSGFEGHEFFEASSLRKAQGKYYFVYSSINSHELCYAVSEKPDRGFRYGGTILSNGDIFFKGRRPEEALNYTGNNHGSIVEINGAWYVFYHRQTNRHQFSRQACAEPLAFDSDGNIAQVEMTSSGLSGKPLAGRPLAGSGVYDARIACNLMSAHGASGYSASKKMEKGGHPYFTQDEPDGDAGCQYIANMRDGSVAGYKYFSLNAAPQITLRVRGSGGMMAVSTELRGKPVAQIALTPPSADWAEYRAALRLRQGVYALYFQYQGAGAVDFCSFTLE